MIHDLSVVQPVCAPKTVFFPHFVVFSTIVGCLVGFLGPLQVNESRLLVSSFLVVLYLCGKSFYSIRVCSLLFPPPPLLGMIFGLCFFISLC